MLGLLRSVYATYSGDNERHRLRVAACFVVAVTVSYFSNRISESALEMMSVVVSILTGFTFTALFSSYSSTTADLPPPKDETDRHDIVRLKEMESNFRARAKFLIVAAMVSLVALLLLSIEIRPRESVRTLAILVSSNIASEFDDIYVWATWAWRIGAFMIKAATVFVFLEAIYTFYRLSETVIAALTLRGEYRASHSE